MKETTDTDVKAPEVVIGDENACALSAENANDEQDLVPKVEETKEVIPNSDINDTLENLVETKNEPANVHEVLDTKIDLEEKYCTEENDNRIGVTITEKKVEVKLVSLADNICFTKRTYK